MFAAEFLRFLPKLASKARAGDGCFSLSWPYDELRDLILLVSALLLLNRGIRWAGHGLNDQVGMTVSETKAAECELDLC
jgi:hypothetical protein